MTQGTAPPFATGAHVLPDPVRLAQLLDLLDHLFVVDAADPAGGVERAAHAIAHVLGVAAVDVTADVPPHGPLHAGARLAPSHAADVVLPFRTPPVTGTLRLSPTAPLAPADVALATVVARLLGLALAGAARWRDVEAVARLRADALAVLGHDLRTPLNALVGYAGLLRDGTFGPLAPEQTAIVEILERQARGLVDLVAATLDVARAERGVLPLRLAPVALATVYDDLAHGTFAEPTRSGTVVWTLPPDLPPVRTDVVKVRQILQNLVDNALKHGAAPVTVEAVGTPTGVRLIVRDRGAGVPGTAVPHLFEPFRPGPGGTSGFGLYAVRRFVEALGGRVTVQSPADGGTAFTVELPSPSA